MSHREQQRQRLIDRRYETAARPRQESGEGTRGRVGPGAGARSNVPTPLAARDPRLPLKSIQIW
jgi:hypothetical protein